MGTWYCWEAIVGGNPDYDVATFPYLENTFYKLGARNDEAPYFSIGENGYWLVDNTDGLLTRHRYQLDENRAGGLAAHLLPVKISGGLGVDRMSNTVAADVKGSQSKYWIMAPIPDPNAQAGPASETQAFIEIPVSQNLTLEYFCPQVTNEPVSVEIDKATQKGMTNWSGLAAENLSNLPVPSFKIAKVGNNAVNTPIKIDIPLSVKVMKPRTVKVVVYPVKLPTSSRSVPRPSEVDLETGLKEIFGKQINAKIDVEIKNETEFAYANAPATEGEARRANYDPNIMGMDASHPMDGFDIRVYLIDGVELHANPGDPDILDGVSRFDHKTSVVLTGYQGTENLDGTEPTDRTKRTKEAVIETMAHEIGHVMGLDHPDEGKGPAPLLKYDAITKKMYGLNVTDLTSRLMCSGLNRPYGTDYVFLVKGEWDVAEQWLKNRPNGDR